MPKHLLTLLLLLCFTAASLRAQVIRGRVVCPDDSTAAAFAVINLVDTARTYNIARTISDKHGKFVLHLGNHKERYAKLGVVPSLLGYKSVVLDVDLTQFPKEIAIMPNEQQLGEAEVRARYFTPTPSGYTYDMSRFKKNLGQHEAFDVLALLPGVMRDGKGEYGLTINGRPFTEIYVNGQRIISIEELRAITADMLQTAEVDFWEGGEITDKDRSATLRIKLGKLERGGYYGSFISNYNLPLAQSGDKGKERFQEFFWWKSNDGKWNVKNVAVYNYDGSVNKSTDTQEHPSLALKEENRTREQRQNHRLNHQLSTVYEFSRKTNAGLSYNFIYDYSKPGYRINNSPRDTYDRYTLSRRNPQHQLTATFYTEWGKRNSRFDMAFDYLTSRETTHHDAYSGTVARADTGHTAFRYRFANDMVKNTMRLHLPLSRALTLRLSDAIQWVDNSYRPLWLEQGEAPALGTQIEPSTTQVLTHYSAAYLMGSHRRTYYSAGFNVRTLDSRYRTVIDTTHYTQWAFNPRASLKFVLDDTQENSFELAYYRELGNVPYVAISQKKVWSDANHYTMGNPNLKAKVEHNLRMQLMHLQGKLSLTGEVQKTEDDMVYQTFADPSLENVYYVQPRNISGEWAFAFMGTYRSLVASSIWLSADVQAKLRRERQEVSGINYNGWAASSYFGLQAVTAFQRRWSFTLGVSCTPTHREYNSTHRHVERINLNYFINIKGKFTVSADLNYATSARTDTRTASGYRLTYRSRNPQFEFGLRLGYHFRSKRQVDVKEVNAQQKYGE